MCVNCECAIVELFLHHNNKIQNEIIKGTYTKDAGQKKKSIFVIFTGKILLFVLERKKETV